MKLTLDDITDLRAYERERDEFRSRIIDLKRVRRVGVGPVVTLVFENRDTIRFQVQEMARAERILTDEAIQTELDTYNTLIPAPGELSATLFIELTDPVEMRYWLPRLVGIERAVVLRLSNGDAVRSIPEEAHDAQLTRESITASVHYVRFDLDADQVQTFGRGPVRLAVDHPEYQQETELSESTRASLMSDWRTGG